MSTHSPASRLRNDSPRPPRPPRSGRPLIPMLLLGGAALSFLAAFLLTRLPDLQSPAPTPSPTILPGAATEAAHTPPPTPAPTDTSVPTATSPPTWTPEPTPVLSFGSPSQLEIEPGSSISLPGACWTSYRVPSPGRFAHIAGLVRDPGGETWAVGSIAGAGSRSQTLLLRWNGEAWEAMASPNVGAGDNRIVAATGDGAGGLWVAGSWSEELQDAAFDPPAADGDPLIAHWDGSHWRMLGSPINFPITAIAASGPDDLWAINSYSLDEGGTRTGHLFQHWSGESWLLVGAQMEEPRASGFLRSMSARSPEDIWAAGGRLIVRWDGERWTQTPFSLLDINAIAVTGPDDAWAVGQRAAGGPATSGALILHWDGRSWTEVPAGASPEGEHRRLQVVTALSPTDVWAAGIASGSTTSQLLLSWDGTAWSEVPVPEQLPGAEITGIARDDSGLWLAGYREPSGSDAPVVEGVLLRYVAADCPPPAPR